MKRKVLLCILLVSLLASLFQNTQKSIAQHGHFSIPLAPHAWKRYGENSTLVWKQDGLFWKPGQKNASIVTRSIPKDWSQFQTLAIEFSSNQQTGNWMTLLIRDQSHHMQFTYFTIDSLHKNTVTFSLHDLFSAFGGDPIFYWNQIESLAICSHPSADQKIETLEIQWHQLSLHTDSSPPSEDPFLFHLAEPIHAEEGILFPKKSFPLLLKKIHTDDRLQKILTFTEPKNSHPVSTEHLRNLVFQYVFLDQGTLDNLVQYFLEIQPDYWDQAQFQNDILVQEHAIHYIVSFELLQNTTNLPDLLQDSWHKNMERICEIQYQTCQRWIRHYPYGKGNNHVTRAASLLGLCSLYLTHPQKQNQFLQYSLQVLHYYFHFQISEDGVLNEGTHYYTYLLEIFTYFSYGIKNALGLNLFQDFPFSDRLNSMVEWAFSIQKPDGYLPSIDDSWQTRVVFPFRFLLPFFPSEADHFLWASTCYKNQYPFEKEPWNIVKSLYIPFSLLSALESDKVASVKPSRKSRMFPRDSDVLFRSMDNDEETYLLFLGKQNPSLHEQNDTGQILLYKGHLPLLLESGYGPSGWTSKNRQYYVSHEAHNVPIVDGSGSESWYNGGVGPIDKSSIQNHYFGDTLSFASMDIQMQIHHPDVACTRTLFHIPTSLPIQNKSVQKIPSYTFVIDLFQSEFPHVYSSVFHPNGTIQNLNASGIHLKLPSEELQYLHIDTSFSTNIQQKTGWYSSYWDNEIEKPYFLLSKRATSTVIESLLSVSNSEDSPFSLQRNPSKNGIEYSISPSSQTDSSSFQDVFMMNSNKSMARGAVISTNGSFCFSRQEENVSFPSSYFVTHASYLNCNQQALFYSPSRVEQIFHSISVSPTNKKQWNFEISSQEEPCVVHFYVPPGTAIQKAFLDEEEVAFQQKDNKISISLPGGKHFLTFE
jgi:hypothetical protein